MIGETSFRNDATSHFEMMRVTSLRYDDDHLFEMRMISPMK